MLESGLRPGSPTITRHIPCPFLEMVGAVAEPGVARTEMARAASRLPLSLAISRAVWAKNLGIMNGLCSQVALIRPRLVTHIAAKASSRSMSTAA
jgi:hypothetical protein